MSSKTIQFGSSQFLQVDAVQEGLCILGDSAPSGRQNLEARVANPLLFGTWMDSKDIRLYSSMNDEQRYRFKEDFLFSLSFIASANVNNDGSVSIDAEQYSQSQGTEFILIGKEELAGADDDYAISSKKYDAVSSALNAARSSGQRFSVDELIGAGGFKVNADLAVDEHIKLKDGRNVLELNKEDIERLSLSDFEYIHAGWHEHFTGSNNAAPEQELEGAKLYVTYLQEANKNNCFPDGKGMDFFVETGVEDYKARSWYVFNSDFRSGANGRNSFGDDGRFLRVRSGITAEGGDAQKIDYSLIVDPFNNPALGLDPTLIGRALNPEGAKLLSAALAVYSAQTRN